MSTSIEKVDTGSSLVTFTRLSSNFWNVSPEGCVACVRPSATGLGWSDCTARSTSPTLASASAACVSFGLAGTASARFSGAVGASILPIPTARGAVAGTGSVIGGDAFCITGGALAASTGPPCSVCAKTAALPPVCATAEAPLVAASVVVFSAGSTGPCDVVL